MVLLCKNVPVLNLMYALTKLCLKILIIMCKIILKKCFNQTSLLVASFELFTKERIFRSRFPSSSNSTKVVLVV